MRRTQLTLAWLCAFTALPLETGAQELPGKQKTAASAPHRRLFLDDQEIAHLENLQRTMHTPVKKGAVIRPERPWEMGLQTRCAPAWDEKAKLWKLSLITSTPFPDVAGMTYVESQDGLRWTRPVLRQYEVNGSRENNFVAVDPKLRWPANAIENVVYDPDDPDPARRFKGLGHCNGRDLLVSPDGIHWQRLQAPRLPSQDESNLTYDRHGRTFLATLKQNGPNGRAVTLATSKDFATWSRPELIFHADDEDQKRARQVIKARLADRALQQPTHHNPADYSADIYNMPIFRYQGHYIGLPAVFYHAGKAPDGNQDGFHHVQLVCSRDLRRWQRLGGRQAFIGPSPVGGGAFDTVQILPPSSPVIRDNELWFYYTGITFRYPPKGEKAQGAICLAVLRRDGFISLDAGPKEGSVLTRPFVLPRGDLYLNVNAAGGSAEAQVCDENGAAIAGFERSAPIRGDHVEALVRWPKTELAKLAGRAVALRVTLRQAQLYSFWFKDK
jgi:hypothetical protein